jgi:hypothetical protein
LRGRQKIEIHRRKTLEDFPKFVVTEVRRGATSETGYTSFELEGGFDILPSSFDHVIEGTGPRWFRLLFGERGYLSPMLKSFDKETRTAILTCQEKEEPRVVGLKLAYLSSYWQAFDVWMVLDPNWGWERKQFQGTDAVRPGTRLVPSGWGHEHCELCNEHIDAGMFGYCDPGERWMCEKCYERYVVPRDLTFVDEL